MPQPPDPAVLAVVPHRAPILRVHAVVANDGRTAHVLGHEPTGPGALRWELGAVEGLAQSAAVLLGHGVVRDPAAPPPSGMLVAVKRYVVHGEPPPAATIDYHVELVRRLGATALVRGRAACAGVALADGELTLWLAPPSP